MPLSVISMPPRLMTGIFATKGEDVSGTDLFTGAGRYLSAAATADSTMNPMEIAQNGIAYVDKALENQPNNSSLLRRRAQLLLVGNGNEMNKLLLTLTSSLSNFST